MERSSVSQETMDALHPLFLLFVRASASPQRSQAIVRHLPRHLVQACPQIDMDVLTDPLSLWKPTLAWWILLEAQTQVPLREAQNTRKNASE